MTEPALASACGPVSVRVSHENAGQRLDRVLAFLLPDMGLRGRRRLCAQGLALVNGKPAPEATKLRLHDVVEIRGAEECDERDGANVLELVESNEEMAAIFKPAGMHTEALAGKTCASVQTMLPTLLPTLLNVELCPDVSPSFRLVNRLDYPTSGLVLAALNKQAATAWETAQRNGHTEKRYIALLEGVLPEARTARHNLYLKGRQRVLAMLEDHPDRRRHTLLEPLALLGADEVQDFLQAWSDCAWSRHGQGARQVTLAGCTILKGARHQIRAHAAALGLPLLGDRRYGAMWTPLCADSAVSADDIQAENERFFLHHGRIMVPGFSACYMPPWLALLGQEAESAAKQWLFK